MESTLVEPGGGEAPRGGGYPLSVLEVRLGGMLACIQLAAIYSRFVTFYCYSMQPVESERGVCLHCYLHLCVFIVNNN